jgi:magnesium-transporting ATPase (P-type)
VEWVEAPCDWRPEALEAVERCRLAGIRVKMITGDHALTATSIARQMGIGSGGKAITGHDIEAASDDELIAAAESHDVFARSSPEHKLRLVRALQARGQVVAMTGDGVNDAPALKQADIGVAMGIKGSEAAKSAAEMVLADDNFASIARAVEEGRTIYDNLRKTILFILPTNGAEALMVVSAVVLAFEHLPITPVQILWVNMVTAVTLALALAFEPPAPGIMRRPPRGREEPILSGLLLWRIVFVAVLIGAAAQFLFLRDIDAGRDPDAARTLAVSTLVAGQLFYLFNARHITEHSLTPARVLSNRAALIADACSSSSSRSSPTCRRSSAGSAPHR